MTATLGRSLTCLNGTIPQPSTVAAGHRHVYHPTLRGVAGVDSAGDGPGQGMDPLPIVHAHTYPGYLGPPCPDAPVVCYSTIGDVLRGELLCLPRVRSPQTSGATSTVFTEHLDMYGTMSPSQFLIVPLELCRLFESWDSRL